MKFWTRSLILLSLVGLCLCSYYLYMEFTTLVEKKDGDSIGTISFKKRNASRRYTDSVIWENVPLEAPVYNYDAIRTQEDSSAVISLKDGTKIDLDQNTMLVVILSDKGLNINFDQGGVSAQSGSGMINPITLNARHATISLNSGDVFVNSSDTRMDIVVNSGKAQVAAAGNDIEISPELTATLKDGIVESKKVSLFPEFPKRNSYIAAFNKTTPVSFAWRSEPRGEVRLEISDSANFSKIIKSYKTSNENQQVELSPGDYHWRIIRGNKKSHHVNFTILADKKPNLTTPYMDQKVILTEGAEIVTFRWEKSQYASAYEITVARDEKMTDTVMKISSRINTISTSELDAGKYFWTVKSLYPSSITPDSIVSGPGRFTMEKMKFSLSKPVPLDPGPVTTAGPFLLNWKGVSGAKTYTVEIAADPDFKAIILSKSTSDSFLKVDAKIPQGKYFWRVSALSGEISSDTSITADLLITEPVRIATVLPQDGAVIPVNLSAINFSWTDPNNGQKYLVEISERKDFGIILKSVETDKDNVNIANPGAGSFYWWVKLLDKRGGIISRSTVSDFVVSHELKAPVTVMPKNNEKLSPGLKRLLRFEWKKSTGATEYEVEVFQRIAGVEKPLMIYTSKTNYINLSNTSMYKTGSYSWLVRAKQVKQGKVIGFKESDQSFFEVERVDLLPPPQVNVPGVLFK